MLAPPLTFSQRPALLCRPIQELDAHLPCEAEEEAQAELGRE